MVDEVRLITLNANELMQALEAYRDANPQFLQPGSIVDFNTASDRTFTVMLGNSGGIRKVELQFSDLMEPVIAHCTKHGVPLPWKSRKSIEIHGSSAVLKIFIDHQGAAKSNQGAHMPIIL